jgi:gluconolactonase
MVSVFSPDGKVRETQPVPADETLDCAFGDADLRTLYVTTAEGHLFRVQKG